jgi:uncharacterized protein (DUF849 family)
LTPLELAAEARLCRDAGASILHLHVRDEGGRHSLDAGRYRDAIAAIEEEVGGELLLQITTEAVGMYSVAEQVDVVKSVVPAAASVAFREIKSEGEDRAAAFFAWASEAEVAIQHILYSADELTCFADFIGRHRLADPAQMLFVVGSYASSRGGKPQDLLDFLNVRPDNWEWGVCGFGAAEFACAAAAIGLGGHVRVGFENNVMNAAGEAASSNSENVGVVARLAQLAGRPIADVETAAAIYGANPRERARKEVAA